MKRMLLNALPVLAMLGLGAGCDRSSRTDWPSNTSAFMNWKEPADLQGDLKRVGSVSARSYLNAAASQRSTCRLAGRFVFVRAALRFWPEAGWRCGLFEVA